MERPEYLIFNPTGEHIYKADEVEPYMDTLEAMCDKLAGVLQDIQTIGYMNINAKEKIGEKGIEALSEYKATKGGE